MSNSINGIPRLGFGTWQRRDDEGVAAILVALEIGYRHLDTAQTYDNEAQVAEAIGRSGVTRDELFITTKIGIPNMARGRALESVSESLDRLKTDRIDLLLIHWPSHQDAVPFEHYMEDLAAAKAKGMARLIGGSNFTIDHLRRAETLLGKGALANNQVEAHPFLQNRTLKAWCDGAGVAVTAYLPVARGAVSEDATLKEIAARHSATPAQISLAFLLAEGFVVIPSSSKRARIEENFKATQVKLTADDLARIRAIDRNGRFVKPAHAPVWDV